MKQFLFILALLLPAAAQAGYSAEKSRRSNPVGTGQLYSIHSGRHASVELAVEKAVRQGYHRSGYGVENEAGNGDWVSPAKAFEIVDTFVSREQKSELGRWVRANGVRRVLNFGVSLSQYGGSAGQALLAFFPADERADVLVIETEFESD
jgi:hypothetical protein